MKYSILIVFFILSVNLSAIIINIPQDYSTIQDGINASANSDTILVQPGTYIENINYNGNDITVTSLFLTTQDTTYISQTIIDGNEDGAVVYFQNYENSNAILCGFTLKNGSGKGIHYEIPGLDDWYEYYGGGIYCKDSSPTLNNLIIENNHSNWGGGLYFHNSSSIIDSVLICNNSALLDWGQYWVTWGDGGGIYAYNSVLTISNTIISYNTANDGSAGGVNFRNSSVAIDNIIINNNVANYSGGVSCLNVDIAISNSEILKNTSINHSGGILLQSDTEAIFDNVEIKENQCKTGWGGGITITNGSNLMIKNSLIADNVAFRGGGIAVGKMLQ